MFFKKIVSFFLLLTLLSCKSYASVNHKITDYHQVFLPCVKNNELRIAIRMYFDNEVPYYLIVNPNTFTTETTAIAACDPRKKLNDGKPGYFTRQELLDIPYVKALKKYSVPPYILENYGLTHSLEPVNGAFLTIDMCPSVKPFEKDFFETLVKMSEKKQRPIPIALSMTGLWIIGHPQEFKWLIQQADKKKLDITWVNHSFSHVYYSDLPYSENFLIEPHTTVVSEILTTEKLLLEHGQRPSIYFRLPGLVSNKKLILTLSQYGLIPLGADAWLAFNQVPTQGSIILVHGNSNEHQGIEKVMPLLQNNTYEWLPLNMAFIKNN